MAEYSIYKGYSNIKETDDLRKLILCAIYILGVFLVVVAMGYLAPDCYMWLVEKTDNEQNQWWWHSFFWAAFLVVAACNASIVAFEIKLLVEGISSNKLNLNPFNIVKLVLVGSVCLLGMIIAQCITATETNDQPPDSSHTALAISFKLRTGTCLCPFAIRLLVLWTFTYFIHLLSLAVLPTVIWVFVLPLRVIFLLTATFATLFCVTAFVAVIISIPTQLQSDNKNVCKVLLLLTVLALISSMALLGTILYFPLIMTSIDSASVAGVITAFLPTAGITAIGWMVKGVGGVEGDGWNATEGFKNTHQYGTVPSHRGRGFFNLTVPWRRSSPHLNLYTPLP